MVNSPASMKQTPPLEPGGPSDTDSALGHSQSQLISFTLNETVVDEALDNADHALVLTRRNVGDNARGCDLSLAKQTEHATT